MRSVELVVIVNDPFRLLLNPPVPLVGFTLIKKELLEKPVIPPRVEAIVQV
jgi:hypothetical protein